MIAVMGMMVVTSTLVTAAFVATESDLGLTRHDLDNKRAYSAARAGVNEFLYRLKQDPNYWATCPTKSKTAVPGSTTQQYSYSPVPVNPPCRTSDPIASMIDTATGTFRMRFTGYSGDLPEAQRSLVASFRRDSPLDFLWYTVYETLDPNTYPDPAFAQQNCAKWKRQGRTQIVQNGTRYCVDIDFIDGDFMRGAMYTQDQLSVCGRPVFGRDSNDKIESLANSVRYDGCPPGGNNADVRGQEIAPAPFIGLPPQNAQLRDDALSGYGTVLSGPTTVELQGAQARITNASFNGSVNLVQKPIIYVDNSGACPTQYSPYGVTYSSMMSGNCGNVYVFGQYDQPVTIAAANDVVVTDDITAASLNGQGMLGLVANNFVRVAHGVQRADEDGDGRIERGECGPNNNVSPSNSDLRIDAAILALQHSFIVDNWDCGRPLGNLTVNGAIAQQFRGTVGTYNPGPPRVPVSGYIKDYTYDNRLTSREPPFLFNINNAAWHIERETLCQLGGSDPATAC